ncbi:hypothetical protein Thiosp_03905 [Thiorhodovibrio litoralis]|nr:hypothetical protein Thiosp_03905 [Thiorhodovibrio litoralis]
MKPTVRLRSIRVSVSTPSATRRNWAGVARFVHNGAEMGVKVTAANLLTREVDRDAPEFELAVEPLPGLAAGRSQNPVADGIDQAVALSNIDDALRENLAQFIATGQLPRLISESVAP